VACRKIAKAGFVRCSYALLAACCGVLRGFGGCFDCPKRFMLHRPGGVRIPVTSGVFFSCIVMSVLLAMNILVAVNTAVVPASVAWPMENRGRWMVGIRWQGC